MRLRKAEALAYLDQLVRDIRAELQINDLPSEFRARRLKRKRSK